MPGSRVIHGVVALLITLAAGALPFGASGRAQEASAPARLSLDLDLSGYETELDRTAEAVQNREANSQLRQSLPRTWHVHTSEGAIDVSTAWLRSELQRIEQDPTKYEAIANRIRSQLLAMRKAATELDGVLQQPASAGARDHLDKILNRPEFAGEQGPSQLELLQAKIARWIERQLFKLLSRLHLGARTGNVLSWGIVAIAVLALCYWIIRSLAGRSRLQQQPEDGVARPNDRANGRKMRWRRQRVATIAKPFTAPTGPRS